jgi:hypothetical protein
MTQTVQQWLAAMPPTKFDQPGRGSPGAFDIGRRGHDEDVPELKQARAPLPRTEKPAHITTAQGDDDDDEIDLDKLVKRLLEVCAERDIPISTVSLEEAAEQLLAHGDAGVPTGRVGAVDAEGLPDEVVKQVLEHCRGKISDDAVSDLEDLLRNGGDEGDPVPPWAKHREAEIERIAEGKDRHSAADMHELYGALDQMEEEARKLMRSRGQFEAPVGRTMRGLRDVGPWHPGKGEPPGEDLPRPAGKPHVPGSLVPKMASDKSFARLMGVKPKKLRKQLPRVLE